MQHQIQQKRTCYCAYKDDDSNDQQSTILSVGTALVKGVEKVAHAVKRISRSVKFSFISMSRDQGKNKRIKSPSKATKEMIRHINAGFDPLSQSLRRWAQEKEEERKTEEQRMEQLIETYEKFNEKSQEILDEKVKKAKKISTFPFQRPDPVYSVQIDFEVCKERIKTLREMEKEEKVIIQPIQDDDAETDAGQNEQNQEKEVTEIIKQTSERLPNNPDSTKEVEPPSEGQKSAEKNKTESKDAIKNKESVVNPFQSTATEQSSNPFICSQPISAPSLMDLIGKSEKNSVFIQLHGKQPSQPQYSPTPQTNFFNVFQRKANTQSQQAPVQPIIPQQNQIPFANQAQTPLFPQGISNISKKGHPAFNQQTTQPPIFMSKANQQRFAQSIFPNPSPGPSSNNSINPSTEDIFAESAKKQQPSSLFQQKPHIEHTRKKDYYPHKNNRKRKAQRRAS